MRTRATRTSCFSNALRVAHITGPTLRSIYFIADLFLGDSGAASKQGRMKVFLTGIAVVAVALVASNAFGFRAGKQPISNTVVVMVIVVMIVVGWCLVVGAWWLSCRDVDDDDDSGFTKNKRSEQRTMENWNQN